MVEEENEDSARAVAIEVEANVRLSAAHLLHALEEERRDAAADLDLGVLLSRIDTLQVQVHSANEDCRKATVQQATLKERLREAIVARELVVAELEEQRKLHGDSVEAHEREHAEFRRRLKAIKQTADRHEIAEALTIAKLTASEEDAAKAAHVALEATLEMEELHTNKQNSIEEAAQAAAQRAATDHAATRAALFRARSDWAASEASLEASLKAQDETSANLHAEARDAHRTELERLRIAHEDRLADVSRRNERDANAALESHAATLRSEHDTLLENALREARAESAAMKEEWNRERRTTHVEHTRRIDQMREGIEQLHDELVSTEASLAQEASRAESLHTAVSKITAEEATASNSFNEKQRAWRQQQDQTNAALRAHLEREKALEAAITQANEDSAAAKTHLEATANNSARRLEREKHEACKSLKSAHAEELKRNAALAKEAHEALERVALDMQQLQRMTHSGQETQTRLTQRLKASNFKIKLHAAAIKIQTAVRNAIFRRHLMSVTKELRTLMLSWRAAAEADFEASTHRALADAVQNHQDHQDQLSEAKEAHCLEISELIDAHNSTLNDWQKRASEKDATHIHELRAKEESIKKLTVRLKSDAEAHESEKQEWQLETLTRVADVVARAEHGAAVREKQLTEAHASIVEAQRFALEAQISELKTDRDRLTGLLADADTARNELVLEKTAAHKKALSTLRDANVAALSTSRQAHMLEMDRTLAVCADRESAFNRERYAHAVDANMAIASAELKSAQTEKEAEQRLLQLETTTQEATARLEAQMVQAHQDALESNKVSMETEIEAVRAEAAASVQKAMSLVEESKTLADREVERRLHIEKRLKNEVLRAEAQKTAWEEMLRKRDRVHEQERNSWSDQREKFTEKLALDQAAWQQQSKEAASKHSAMEDAWCRATRQLEVERREKTEAVTSKAKEVSRLREDLAQIRQAEASFAQATREKVTLLQDRLMSMEVKLSQEKTASSLKIGNLTRQLENAMLDLSCLRQVKELGVKEKVKGAEEETAETPSLAEIQQASETVPFVSPMNTIDDALDLDDVQQLMHQRQRHMLMQRQMLAERRTHQFLSEKADQSRELLEGRIRKMADEIEKKSLEISEVRAACSKRVAQIRDTFALSIQDIVHDRDAAVERLLGVEREELATLRVQIKARECELLKSAAQIKALRHDAAADRSRHGRQRKQFAQRMGLMHKTLMELTEAFRVANHFYSERDSERGKVMDHALDQLSLLPDREALRALSPVKVKDELATIKGLLTPEPEKEVRRWL